MAESREDERAMSKDIDGGEMLENGEVKNTPLAYLDMTMKKLKSEWYPVHIL